MESTDHENPTDGDTLSVFDLTSDSVAELLTSQGQPAYRSKQVLEWVYEQRAQSFDDMTNLPKALRSALAEKIQLYQSTIVSEQASSDGTIKLLLRWPDGGTSECVLIPDGDRRTACISTQIGCPVGCVFCASGIGGLERQLSAGQIVEQAMRVRALCGADRLSNVVFMGLGEPLANYNATVQAVRTINADWGLGIGARKITVSTVGLPTRMRQLGNEGLQITLALSLHAPTDELRRKIIPWADRVTIEELTEAANAYFAATGREITLEYILLGGLNDGITHAKKLARLAKRMRSNINLLIYNPVAGLPYLRPEPSAVDKFYKAIRDTGMNVNIRRSRGLDIDAACGQLRRREAAPSVETM